MADSKETNKPFDEKNRMIFLHGDMDEDSCSKVVEKLLEYECKCPTKDILLYIDSGGGLADGFISIHDTIKMLRCPVVTICIGTSMSAAALLLMSGQQGKRFITPNSRVMLHELASGSVGKVTELETDVVEVKRMQQVCEKLILRYTKINKQQLKTLMEKDSYMTARQAQKFGIVDHVVHSSEDLYSRISL